MISASELCTANNVSVDEVSSAILSEGTRVDFMEAFSENKVIFSVYAARVLLSIRRAGYSIRPYYDEADPVDPDILVTILGRVFSRLIENLSREGIRQWSQTIGDTSIQQTFRTEAASGLALDDEDWELLAEFYGGAGRPRNPRGGSVSLWPDKPQRPIDPNNHWVDWKGQEWWGGLP